jgi:hypothetical protein
VDGGELDGGGGPAASGLKDILISVLTETAKKIIWPV